MGQQPPLPGKRGIPARTLLHRHPIALKTEVAQKVPNRQHDK